MNTPTDAEIDAEIEKLKEMKPKVRQFGVFGNDNHAAIEAQIKVLARRLSEDEAEDKYVEAPDASRDSAVEAARWIGGEAEDGSPSEGWAPLCD